MIRRFSFIFNLALSFVIAVTLSSAPVAYAANKTPQKPLGKALNPEAPLEFTLRSGNSVAGEKSESASQISSITTRVIDATHVSEEVLELQLEQIVNEVSAVTIIEPDESSALAPSFYARSESIANKFKFAAKNYVTVSSKKFSDWFQKRKMRVTIIAFEITLMSGLKFTELMITSQPPEVAPALTASLLIGSIIGYVEWYTPELVRLYRTHNSFVKKLITKLNENAHKRSAAAVDTFWWFTKNAALNTFLYSQFKIILYASMKADGSLLERIVSGAHMITAMDTAMFVALGFGATGAGMPTSQLITQYSDRLKKEAGTDPVKLNRADDKLTFWWSTALTARAAAFSSLLIGYTFDWPALMGGATAAIVTMSGGSWWLKRRAEMKAKSCNAALEK